MAPTDTSVLVRSAILIVIVFAPFTNNSIHWIVAIFLLWVNLLFSAGMTWAVCALLPQKAEYEIAEWRNDWQRRQMNQRALIDRILNALHVLVAGIFWGNGHFLLAAVAFLSAVLFEWRYRILKNALSRDSDI